MGRGPVWEGGEVGVIGDVGEASGGYQVRLADQEQAGHAQGVAAGEAGAEAAAESFEGATHDGWSDGLLEGGTVEAEGVVERTVRIGESTCCRPVFVQKLAAIFRLTAVRQDHGRVNWVRFDLFA